MNIIDQINQENLKATTPSFNVGDTVKVSFEVIEGDKTRIQVFEGVVIAKRHGSISETFTVRRLSFGIGVERTFPIHSPKVVKVDPEKAKKWIANGAQPTDTVKVLFKKHGVL